MSRKGAIAIPSDTSLQAARVQADALRRLGGVRRVAMALELSQELRALTAAGIRHRHPERSESSVLMAVTRLWIGDALYQRAYPDVRVDP